MEKPIIELLKKIILEKYNLEINEIKLETPPKKEFGDYAFGGFLLSKELKKSPMIIVNQLKEIIEGSKEGKYSFPTDLIDSVNCEGPYLNIKLNKLNLIDYFREYNYKKIQENHKNKTIYVDYIGTNVGKPLHIGHMCTPNQGQTIINVYKKLGYNVISDSHIGDWGIIFGKLITAFKLYGDENKLKENAVEHLFDLYVKITKEVEESPSLEEEFRKEFKLLSEGNPESIKLWESFTKESIKAMQKQLRRLNINEDFNIGESFYEGLGLPKIEEYPDLKYNMNDIVEELIDKEIAKRNDDGSVGVNFPEETKMPSCILQKRDGTNLYLTSDLCAIKYRTTNWDLEEILYFVDVRQQLHLKQAFEIAKMAGWLKKENGENVELFHAYNGFITLKEGAMSTRHGRIIKLDKLLDEAEDRAKKIILEKRDDIKGEELDNLARIIGIGAIKYGYLKKSRETDVVFDWDEFMTFEGNSGPYIQYAYVRARRILEKADLSKNENYEISKDYDYKDVKEKIKSEALDLIKLLLKYNSKDGVLFETAEKCMPHILASYSYELTKSFNAFYNNVDVLKEENKKLKNLSLSLTKSFSETIKDCFELLGIKMPEKM